MVTDVDSDAPFNFLKRFMRKPNTLEQYLMGAIKLIVLVMALVMLPLALFKPQSFLDLWMTRDQQGQLLFYRGKYDEASQRFISTRWQAYSFYGAEQFDSAALLFSQYSDVDNLLAHANALAHASRYIEARDAYLMLLQQHPEFLAAKKNLSIVQGIIDDINRMSESQKPEGNSQALEDEPVRADGADKQEARVQEVEQLTSDQLLLDPELNEMWMRQVQKDPARFLALKFQAQLDDNKPVPQPLETTNE